MVISRSARDFRERAGAALAFPQALPALAPQDHPVLSGPGSAGVALLPGYLQVREGFPSPDRGRSQLAAGSGSG